MVTKVKMTVLACVMVLSVGGLVPTGQALATPVIEDFSSAGGQTQSKTGPADKMYLVKSGEKIIFAVDADGAEKYVWQVNNKVQDKAEGDSFTWTVPAEKSNWDITVVVSGIAGSSQLTWSVTTSAIKTVKPGESIQKAIDSLPAEGGIVELLAGTWELTDPIKITKRNNVTLRGAGIDKTILRTDKMMVMIQATLFEDNAWILTEKTGGRAALNIKRMKELGGMKGIFLEDFSLIGNGVVAKKPIFRWGGVLLAKVVDSRITNVRMEKTGQGIHMLHCRNMAIEKCKWKDNNLGGLLFLYCCENLIENCRFESCSRWYAIDLNGFCHKNRIIGNVFENNRQGDLKLYSWSKHNEVIGNIFNGNGRCNIGVYILNGACNLVQGNIFTAYRAGQYKAAVVQRACPGSSHPPEFYNHDNRIINNVFYSCEGGAVRLVTGGPLEVRNNIIVKMGAKAIVGVAADKCSHNNLWKNASGDTGGGTGSISADPLFANPDKGDFHLKSKTWRWEPKLKKWVKFTSPCIDAGDPKAKFSNEPSPNGGRINMGAYGNTPEASKSATKGK